MASQAHWPDLVEAQRNAGVAGHPTPARSAITAFSAANKSRPQCLLMPPVQVAPGPSHGKYAPVMIIQINAGS